MSSLAEIKGPDMEPPDESPQCCRCHGPHLHEADRSEVTAALNAFAAPLKALRLLCDRLDEMRSDDSVFKEIVRALGRGWIRLEWEEALLSEFAGQVQYCKQEILCASCDDHGYRG